MEIKRVGSQASAKGPSDWFTGTVRIDPLFTAPDPALVSGASVTFEPGARTAWHTHPLGQTLVVTAGCGWVQREGGPVDEIHPGDIVWIPPHEKHWHGASPTTAMTHIAIQEKKDGKVVDWMEHVTDQQYRKALFSKGLTLRVISQVQYVQNVLDAPVPAHDQVYVGQRPFESAMVQPILVSDLRQLHLRHAQLYMGSVWNWVSWNPAGPKAFQLWDLYFYKAFGEKRAEIKAGYVSLNLDFIGLFVGGSTATGAQGVYAVLPYEAGMSYFPLTTPAMTVQFRGPNHTYFKPGAQRSIDSEGGPTEVARNHTGFRFLPHGDKLLLIGEGGYLREARRDAHEAWFRLGYMYNTTGYRNVATGRTDSGNYCTYVLMDYQLHRPSLDHPSHGIYAGGSFMTAPESLNPYSRYYEARLYKEVPFRGRPADLLSVVASRTKYSSQYTNSLVLNGKTVWRGGTTLTGSYSARVSPGNYASVRLTYVYGPAITPRVPNALKVTATWTSYF